MSEAGGKYRRDMGTLGVLFIVVNGLIGAGIFGLPELLHGAVGGFAPWLLLVGGLLVMSIVLCFAELTRLTDRSGGPQRFVTDAFGRFAGFEVGWTFYAARMLSQAANSAVLIAYAAAIWPVLGDGIARGTAIVTVLAALTIINIVGIRRVVAALGAMTALKLVPLILLALVALVASAAPGEVALPRLEAVEGIALATLYAFVGFENATIPAGETREPRRAMPRALLIGLPVVTLLYFALQWAYSASPIAGSGPEAPVVELARLHWGDVGALLIAATVVMSVLANMTAGHTSASRMTPAMADDGLLPGWFGRVSRWGTPANSIAFFGVGSAAFALSGTFAGLAAISTLARLLAYIGSIFALPRLRRGAGLTALTPTIVLAAPVALGLSLWATFQTTAVMWQTLAAFALVGAVLFALARRAR
ncbi:APC family permease [Sphingomicrobium astaxanthinifaciens]|uniref:APC family permease n=1 Tax=Sphingomicrobium astaxanthinifaciens TaxID=1227949 RepID=UPI001FCA7223|nr:APC family permease [Sphingomicrobium astaxanthinifaciens]MCJ7420657.1 APC family permease [Sphingomicrobium astaxanthinifaciens]